MITITGDFATCRILFGGGVLEKGGSGLNAISLLDGYKCYVVMRSTNCDGADNFFTLKKQGAFLLQRMTSFVLISVNESRAIS